MTAMCRVPGLPARPLLDLSHKDVLLEQTSHSEMVGGEMTLLHTFSLSISEPDLLMLEGQQSPDSFHIRAQ
jgi:hypothetical protein